MLSALTGSASGGLTIALDALGGAYLQMANNLGIDPSVIHRVRSGHRQAAFTMGYRGWSVLLLAPAAALVAAAGGESPGPVRFLKATADVGYRVISLAPQKTRSDGLGEIPRHGRLRRRDGD